MESMLRFVSSDMLEQLREKRRAVEAARAEIQRLTAAITNAQASLSRVLSNREDEKTAAARFLGEIQSPWGSTVEAGLSNQPVTSTDLSQIINGLQQRRSDAETALTMVTANFRVAVLAVLTKAADAVGSRYAELGRELSRLWTQILGMQQLTVEMGDIGGRRAVIDYQTWGRLLVPGSESKEIPSIAQASKHDSGAPIIFSGQAALQSGAGESALHQLKEEMQKAIGAWPFERGA